MGDSYPKIRVGVVQAASVFLDREGCLEKAIGYIEEAGRKQVSLLAFPEGFIPAHPIWYHFMPATAPKSLMLAVELFKNSVEIPSPATDALCAAAARARTHVVIGVCEVRDTCWAIARALKISSQLIGLLRRDSRRDSGT